MFAAILRTQWKWTRSFVLIGFVMGFAIPLVSLITVQAGGVEIVPSLIVRDMQQFGSMYALLAAGGGLACAMLGWGHDHRGRHVYALSLPVPRSRYTAMRFGAGAIFLLVPVAGVLLGCLVGLALVKIPTGLNAYPLALTTRFLLASFVSYSLFFAILASSTKASSYVLGGIGAVLAMLFLLTYLGIGQDIISGVALSLFGDRGLLSVFTGRWMLIDV